MTNEIVSPSTVYWITRLDAIHTALSWAAACCLFAGCYASIFALIGKDKDVARLVKWLLSIGVVCGVVVVFVPTTREGVAMSVIPAIANNQDVQGLGADLVTTAREWLQELRPVKEAK